MHSVAYLFKGGGKMYKSAYFNFSKKTVSSNEIRREKRHQQRRDVTDLLSDVLSLSFWL